MYFEIVRGCYDLPQSGKLAKDLFYTRLKKVGYFESATTPGLRKHTCRPIQFCLIVDDFGIAYVGEKHVQQLNQVLQDHYEISEYWEGEKFAGIAMEWNYADKYNDCTFHLSMKGYIEKWIIHFGHNLPAKPQIFPHKHWYINYGAKVQLDPEEADSRSLDTNGIKHV